MLHGMAKIKKEIPTLLFQKMVFHAEPLSPICVCAVLSGFGCVQPFATLLTVAHQTPLSMIFSRQVCWSGLPCPHPGNLPNPGIKLASSRPLNCGPHTQLEPTDSPTPSQHRSASGQNSLWSSFPSSTLSSHFSTLDPCSLIYSSLKRKSHFVQFLKYLQNLQSELSLRCQISLPLPVQQCLPCNNLFE